MLKKAFGIVGMVCFILALNHVTLLAAEIEAPVIVVIDPGHGGVPGETEANGGANYHDVYEKRFEPGNGSCHEKRIGGVSRHRGLHNQRK